MRNIVVPGEEVGDTATHFAAGARSVWSHRPTNREKKNEPVIRNIVSQFLDFAAVGAPSAL
jgi:hypothetical protein